MIKGVGYVNNFSARTFAQKLWALMAIAWFFVLFFLIWKLWKVYRRGQFVAVTTDGLIIRMVGVTDKLIPWTEVATANIAEQAEKRPQVAVLKLVERNRSLSLGGIYNVFPTRAHVERFVAQVNERAAACQG